ncbi:MAG: amidase family protein [Microbacterium sp.]
MPEFDDGDLRAAAERLGFGFTDAESADALALGRWMLDQVDDFVKLAPRFDQVRAPLKGTRRIIGSPTPENDPLNAIVRWVDVVADASERTSDLLAGKRIALKDLISVAGMPLTGASRHLEGYIADEDAPLVTRILQAGGRIVAFTNLEGMAFGGGGESSCFGPTRNPFDLNRSASGSSSGSAAALFYDDVDIAFGTDQGGSIRQPAAWCGVLGLKPTHGLVPYTGILSHDPTIDHVGPMALTTVDVAAALEAVAGWTPDDPRQAPHRHHHSGGYLDAVNTAPDSLAGMRIGVVQEALLDDGSPERAEVLAGFKQARAQAAALGAEVVDLSIASHAVAGPIMFAIMLEGIAATVHGYGEGFHWAGRHSTGLRRGFAEGLRERGTLMPPAYRIAATVGEYLRTRDFGTVYATAQNVAARLRSDYDAALSEVDVLMTPTTPGTAMTLSGDVGMLERELRSFTMGSSLGADTPAHNLTGHPALSMPASTANGLPAGVMLIGQHRSDGGLLGIARVWERELGWLPLNGLDHPALTLKQRNPGSAT